VKIKYYAVALTLLFLFFGFMSEQAESAAPGIEWQKSFGSDDRYVAYSANSIRQASDGGYIFAINADLLYHIETADGNLLESYSIKWPLIVKLNASGDTEWEKYLDGSLSDKIISIRLTSDGGYILAGYIFGLSEKTGVVAPSFDAWIIRLKATGETEWEKRFGGSGWDEAYSIQQTSDGGYIFAGYTDSRDGDLLGKQSGLDIFA